MCRAVCCFSRVLRLRDCLLFLYNYQTMRSSDVTFDYNVKELIKVQRKLHFPIILGVRRTQFIFNIDQPVTSATNFRQF